MNKETFPIWNSLPSMFQWDFLILPFPKQSCQRMTIKISLKKNDWVFHTDHDFGHLCRGRRIQMSGHSDLGIFSNSEVSSIFIWVSADTVSAACPAQPGNLEMISMTSAAVICDADDPSSVNTAEDPESSFTISPRSTTRPLYFWCFCLQFSTL